MILIIILLLYIVNELIFFIKIELNIITLNKVMYVLTEKQMLSFIQEIKEGRKVNILQYKKRSRTINEVNKQKQCRAKRADGKQCSRQRKEGQGQKRQDKDQHRDKDKTSHQDRNVFRFSLFLLFFLLLFLSLN